MQSTHLCEFWYSRIVILKLCPLWFFSVPLRSALLRHALHKREQDLSQRWVTCWEALTAPFAELGAPVGWPLASAALCLYWAAQLFSCFWDMLIGTCWEIFICECVSLRSDKCPFNRLSLVSDQQLSKMLEMKIETLVSVECCRWSLAPF